MRSRLVLVSFLLVVVLGGWSLRLYGLNWDQGYGVHPDERYITWVAASVSFPDNLSAIFDPHQTSLDPYVWPPSGIEGEETASVLSGAPKERSRPFSYGHLPLYLLVLTAGGDADEARLALVGRVLSALFDTVTIVLTFALGRLLYNAAAGVLAAVFVALTVMHIQQAHFATFDTALTCFVIAALLFTARFARCERRRDAMAAGICLGLAAGSKFSAILLLVPLVAALLLRWEYRSWRDLHHPLALGLLGLFVAFLAFGLTNPFSLIQPGELIYNLRQQGAMLRGDDNFPFTLQYYGMRPYLYPVEQQLRWGIGLPLGLVAFGGLGYALFREWRSPLRAEVWIPVVWVVVYFGFFGGLHVKFMRYMLPMSPVLAVFGAEMLRASKRWFDKWQVGTWRMRENRCAVTLLDRWRGRFGLFIVGVVALPALLYALGFLNVYSGDHPWLRLSRWIYAHIPARATIAHERWDHHLPLTISQGGVTRWPGEFIQQALDPYAPDTLEKLRTLLGQLAASDYLVIASNRLYGSTAQSSERYPLMQRYYERLFDGQLGYRLVPLTGIERHPQLGPLALVADPFRAAGLPSPLPPECDRPAPATLNLGRADESFTVYDHPRPLLFQNIARLSQTEMERLFADLLSASDRAR